MENIKIFACNSAKGFAKEICECLDLKLGEMDSFKFKNDNNFVQYKETVREQDVYIVQTSLPPVNENIMELLLAIDAAKRAAAKNINVVVPYFPYSRSDKKDQPRIPITASLIAKLLEAAGATRVITCDLHNGAIQAYFNIQCERLTGERILEKYFESKELKDIAIVATDAGSAKKAYKYSKYFAAPMVLIDKRRKANNDDAKAINIIGDIKGKTAIIFDDEISTGGTLTEAARIVEENGAKEIYAACTHGILCGNAIKKIEESPIKELIITDTVPMTPDRECKKIKIASIAPLFAEAIKRINEATPDRKSVV